MNASFFNIRDDTHGNNDNNDAVARPAGKAVWITVLLIEILGQTTMTTNDKYMTCKTV